MPRITYKPLDKEEARSQIGIGIHTGLRKGTDAPEAHDLWVAINKSDRAWSEALAFLVSGLDQMNMVLCEKVEANGEN